MHPGLAEQPAYVAMFVEEARLGAALESPNLAEVRDFIHEYFGSTSTVSVRV